MNFKLLSSAVTAVAILAFAGTLEPAQARHGGDGGGFHMGGMGGGHPFMGGGRPFMGGAHRFMGGVRHFGQPHFRHHLAFRHPLFRHHRFHRHRFVVVGAFPYYYADGCYWLKRRALYTGSAYWWHRYYACRSY